jgi:hypothetical protein
MRFFLGAIDAENNSSWLVFWRRKLMSYGDGSLFLNAGRGIAGDSLRS